MSDYQCTGCDSEITDEMVVVGKLGYSKDSETGIFNAGELSQGDGSIQIATTPTSCVSKYIAKNPTNDVVNAEIIPIAELDDIASE